MKVHFPIEKKEIEERLRNFSPKTYAKTRNFIGGNVSYFSPYISRGIWTTRKIFDSLIQNGYNWDTIEKFVQELAWRDYWQICWWQHKEKINTSLKKEQNTVIKNEIPLSILQVSTNIKSINEGINQLNNLGYIHNHMRMYISSIICNIANCQWEIGAKWMYYHLLDGDWASNTLSWQWVAGTNSNKKYFANQDNINKYCSSKEKGTFLDVEYDQFPLQEIPKELKKTSTVQLKTKLPNHKKLNIDATKEVLIYNYYNIQYDWKRNSDNYNHVLLLEPSFFNKYPISENVLHFFLSLANNINDLQIFVGEFKELQQEYKCKNFRYKSHPTNKHYQGVKEEIAFLCPDISYQNSFFKYWKKCKKELIKCL